MKPGETQAAVVRILYFARLREALDRSEEELVLPEGVGDVGSLLTFLRERGGAWANELAPGKAVRAAVNQDMSDAQATIKGGDEIAFFPPVTGG
ncbi:MAG TPA: molybdopterin converting factor subunit 1 [Burkholderiales bacterium]|nr:molybdopterin converting factor subunit 1 [Burkholderiales bacterium]